jgi:hypothetical protein
MPLAFDDATLARLAIAASRIPVHARSRWLQQLAHKLDPPPRPATRQARWCAWQRNDRAIFRVEADHDAANVERATDMALSETPTDSPHEPFKTDAVDFKVLADIWDFGSILLQLFLRHDHSIPDRGAANHERISDGRSG